MDKQKLLENYEKNVNWLRRNIPPDDIYDFAEQTYMAALFFLKLASSDDRFLTLLQECHVTRKWSQNICGLLQIREQGIDCPIDMKLEIAEDD